MNATMKPRAWLCELAEEDGTTRTQFVEEDPDGLRWNDAGEPSPYRTTPLLTMEQAAQMVDAERARIAASLRRSGATLPAPEVKGTPESGIITGLCIALTLVESGPNARLTAPDTALQEQR